MIEMTFQSFMSEKPFGANFTNIHKLRFRPVVNFPLMVQVRRLNIRFVVTVVTSMKLSCFRVCQLVQFLHLRCFYIHNRLLSCSLRKNWLKARLKEFFDLTFFGFSKLRFWFSFWNFLLHNFWIMNFFYLNSLDSIRLFIDVFKWFSYCVSCSWFFHDQIIFGGFASCNDQKFVQLVLVLDETFPKRGISCKQRITSDANLCG